MSREFQLKEIEGKKCIAFPIQSVREVDDIILQLLNDADQDGFLKSKVIKAQKEIVFETGSLTSLDALPASVLPRDQFICILKDLKDMLVSLKDSVIGPEYVSFDEKSVFIDPDSRKLYLTVLPLQNPGHDDSSMQGLIKNLISKFSPEGADAFYDLAASKAASGITKITDVDNLIYRLKEEAAREPAPAEIPVESETPEEVPSEEISVEETTVEEAPIEESPVEEAPVEEAPVEEVSVEEDAPSEIPVTFDEKAAEMPEEEKSAEEEAIAEPPLVEQIEKEPAVIEEAAEEIPVEEESAEELPVIEEAAKEVVAEEKAAIEETPDRTIVFDKKTGEELHAALSAAEVVLPPVIESELREAELPTQLEIEVLEDKMSEESVAEKSIAEMPEEETAAESEEMTYTEESSAGTEETTVDEEIPSLPSAYLFRKKSSELIQLTSDPFVIGKIPMACDYVITDNPALSRIHAIIRFVEEEGAYYIIDCNSTNHVYLNGIRVAGQQIAKLADKDRIHLATEAFVFHIQN